MLLRILPPRLLLAAAVLALPLTGGGCGRRACFTWSASEGSCPAQAEALQFFSTPRCPGKITSVESAPTNELDGALCCYDVTANEELGEQGCQGFGGSNSVAVGSGLGGSVGFAVATSAGQGGAGGGIPCAHCAEMIDNSASAPPCSDMSTFFMKELIGCACSGTCAMLCGDTLCPGNPPTPECSACLQDPVQGCGNELDACLGDI